MQTKCRLKTKPFAFNKLITNGLVFLIVEPKGVKSNYFGEDLGFITRIYLKE